jgi:hypothetical protein
MTSRIYGPLSGICTTLGFAALVVGLLDLGQSAFAQTGPNSCTGCTVIANPCASTANCAAGKSCTACTCNNNVTNTCR